MLPLERKQDIVRMIQKTKSVKVTELSLLYNVTEETIRRDLEKLEKENIVKKTYGGAILIESPTEDLPFVERAREHTIEKKKLASYAVDFIKDGDTVMLDSSTTALEVVRAFRPDLTVTVITNSLNAASELAVNPQCKIISTGGILNAKTMSFEGPTAVKNLSHYYADKAIVSCKGVDLERGMMESSEYVAEIKKVMISAAKQVILVVDASKFEQSSLVRIGDLSGIHVIVTNKALSEAWIGALEKLNIEVILAE